ncbi:MAG: glycosyltransferase [Tenuifilaceae bacterium]
MKEIISNSTIYELVLVSVLIVSLLIQLFYYLGIYLKVAIYNKKDSQNDNQLVPISVVICARDEEENLENFLPYVLEQDYPNYEVIVVNDCSSDNSDITLDRMMKKYSNLKVTTIKEDEKFSHNKKLALTVGIKAAKNDWVLLTDADCRPDDNKWLASMASNFYDNVEIVLGYGGFFEERSFLNKLIRFDALFIAMQYLGLARVGKPYMGVGRNLAYRKSLFFKNKGFASHAHINSGDDDLFINEVAKSYNTKVEFRHDAHTRTIPRKKFSSWVTQKRRHISTGMKYKLSSKLFLGGEIISRIIFYASAIALIALLYYPWVIVGVVGGRWIIQLSIIKGVMNRLNERKILLLSLLYDFFSIFFYSTLAILNILNPSKPRWR